MNYYTILKTIFLGNKQSGKTTIINNFLDDNYLNLVPTIGINYISKEFSFKIENNINNAKLIIYDYSLNHKFNYFDNLNKIIFKNINVFFIVFNLNNIESFNSIDNWNNIIKQNIDKDNIKTNNNTQFNKKYKILIGNKFHEKNKISLSKILNKCKKLNLIYIENIDIKNKLNSLIYQIICSFNNNQTQENIDKIKNTFYEKNNKHDCIIN